MPTELDISTEFLTKYRAKELCRKTFLQMDVMEESYRSCTVSAEAKYDGQSQWWISLYPRLERSTKKKFS